MDGQKARLTRVTIDTGIYQDEHFWPGKSRGGAVTDGLVVREEPVDGLELTAQVTPCEAQRMAELLGEVDAVIANPATENQLHEACRARGHLEKLRDACASGDISHVGLFAFLSGQYMERLRVRGMEKNALSGKKRRLTSAKGGRGTRKLTYSQRVDVYNRMLLEVQHGSSRSAAAKRVVGRLAADGIAVSESLVKSIFRKGQPVKR